ncbi:MAG TPA: hypothetical protein VNB94_00815 [Mycobacteriales bacterium]|nr:hypothetical protein [Mycobacteriales bacterium]
MTSSPPGDPWREPSAPPRLAPGFDPWQSFVAGEPVRRRERLRHRGLEALRASRVPALLAVSVLLLGAPAGLLWARVSPTVSVSFSAQGPSLDRPESSEFFAAEGSFGVVLLVFGLVTGAVVWRVLRQRATGVGVPVGLAIGALLAGLVAQAVGSRFVVDSDLAALCGVQNACPIYDGTLQLRARGLVVIWAVAALAAYVALSLLRDDPEPSVE